MSKRQLNVPPSDNIFVELGDNNYTDLDLISELVDNAAANRVAGTKLEIRVEVCVSEDPTQTYFLVRDNAAGIPFDEIGLAISPGGTAHQGGNSLSEHGLGMKQAIASAGRLEHIKTKTIDEDRATVVREFRYGDIGYDEEDVPWDHGTEIRVDRLESTLIQGRRVYFERIKAYLGARYRRLMNPEDPDLEVRLVWRDRDRDEIAEEWVGEVRPTYFHPNKRQNRPVVHRKEFAADDGSWKALLTFGYAPETDQEYDELGVTPPKKYEPYAVALKKQGLDLLMHDRVIQFHQLHEIGLVSAPHNQYNHIRGEIDLLHGFSTAITKNLMKQDGPFHQAVGQIKQFLEEEDLLKGRHAPSDLPEKVLRDRLAGLLRRPPYNCTNVATEVVVDGLAGFVDVVADNDPWEIKTMQAGGLDVYQLLAYMDFRDDTRGSLVAESFTNGARQAAKLIEERHGREITLIERENLAINQPMTTAEVEQYV